MARPIMCDRDPAHGEAAFMVSDTRTGQVKAFCEGCYAQPAPTNGSAGVRICDMDPEHGPAATTIIDYVGGNDMSLCASCFPTFCLALVQQTAPDLLREAVGGPETAVTAAEAGGADSVPPPRESRRTRGRAPQATPPDGTPPDPESPRDDG